MTPTMPCARVAEGPVKDVLDWEKLDALYRARVERLADSRIRAVAFPRR